MSPPGRPKGEYRSAPREDGPMSYRERALMFDCCGERLVGVLAEPAQARDVGVVINVGGPQYRIGSHRQFVRLARSLAASGVATLRYDVRGMGDATGAMRSFEDTGPDIAAAIDALLAACPTVTRIVLWGLCDAASSALLYWHTARDPRISGMVMVNPWVRSDATLAKTHLKHYYGQRLLQREFWAKAVRGHVDMPGAITSITRKLAAARRRSPSASAGASFQDRMAEGLRMFAGPVLVLLSGRDLTAKEFLEFAQSSPRWTGLLESANVERHDLAEADHTFSTARWRSEVESRTIDWLRRTLTTPGCA